MHRELYDFAWYFGDGDSLVSNNEVVFHEYAFNGLYDVTLRAKHKLTECTNLSIKSDYIYCTGGNDPSTGMNVNENYEEISVRYIIHHQEIEIIHNTNFPSPYQVLIMDLSGRIVAAYRNPAIYNFKVSLSSLTKGVYLVVIKSNSYIAYRKIIKW